MTVEDIVAWFRSGRDPALAKDQAILAMHAMHPRTIFVKTLPYGARVLDLDADGGGLEIFRRWPPPARNDLRMHVYSATKSDRLDRYDGHEIGQWPPEATVFADVAFDAIVVTHAVARLDDAIPLLEWSERRLAAGGRLYLEWQSPFSELLPTRDQLAAHGISITISNFRDDATHRRVHDRGRIVAALTNAGFFIETQGYVSLPFIEDEIVAQVRAGMRDDAYAVQLAYWSRTRWLQYLVANHR